MANLKYYNSVTSQWETLVVGAQGEQGETGETGATGAGVQAGGTANQLLAKIDSTDYNTQWVNAPNAANGIPAGGLEGQILAKLSDTDYDSEWIDNYAGELRIIVKNDSGVTINKGEAVMAVDAVGDRIRVAKAVADGSVSSRYMLGVAAEAIANGAEGYISLLGEIKNLDTIAYPIGTVLFIDPAVPGALTDEEPESPALDMNIAIVTRSHATTGILFIRMWGQGVDLNEVHDVNITGTLADNEVLAYDTTSSLWINQTPAEAGLVTEGDARLTDARTPTAHAASHASGGSDALSIIASQINDLASGVSNFLTTPTSANLASAVTDETGTGNLVFSANPTFSGTVSGITKGMVGLGNVDNTSDANKPLSTAAQNEKDYVRAYLNNLSDAIADLNARTPFRMEVRSTDVGGTSAVLKSVGVTFTSGRFTLAPRVTATVTTTNTGALMATVDNLGSTGFTLRVRHSDNTAFAGTATASWIAIQRSSGAASG